MVDSIKDYLYNLTEDGFFKKIAKIVPIISISLLILQLIAYSGAFYAGKNPFFISLLFTVILSMITVIYAGKTNTVKVPIYCFLLSAGMTVLSLILGLGLQNLLQSHFIFAFVVTILSLTALISVLIMLQKKTWFLNWFDDFNEEGIYQTQSNQYKPGDLILGYDLNKGTPNVEPLKDRFLHMQAYGPTGSGKTSQVLLPMILKDLLVKDAVLAGHHYDSIAQIVLEPKGDLAEQFFRMANILGGHNPHNIENPTTINGKEMYYFNPMILNTPTFNPLHGPVAQVTENIVVAFQAFATLSTSSVNAYFLNAGNVLLRNAVNVIKTVYGDEATLIDLESVMTNLGGKGEKIIAEYAKMPMENPSQQKQQADRVAWFTGEYYNKGANGQGNSKAYEAASGMRDIIAKLNSNPYLRSALNPTKDSNRANLNFDEILANGDKVAISVAQGALGKDLSRYLGIFLMLQIQEAITHRPGNENNRRPGFFYIDEFQVFATSSFDNVLTQGRSYCVGVVLATQSLGQIEKAVGPDFMKILENNARTKLTFPGASIEDAEYFSKEFSQKKEVETRESISSDTTSLFGAKPRSKSVSEVDTMAPKFTPDQIKYGINIYDTISRNKENTEANFMFYQMMKNGISQYGKVARTKYIPVSLYKALNENIPWYKAHVEAEVATGLPAIWQPELFGKKVYMSDVAINTELEIEATKNQESDVKNAQADVVQDADQVDVKVAEKSDISKGIEDKIKDSDATKTKKEVPIKEKKKKSEVKTSLNHIPDIPDPADETESDQKIEEVDDFDF